MTGSHGNPSAPRTIVFDTGPLSHLAQAGWLGVLRSVTGGAALVIPDVVADELKRGSGSRPHLELVLEAKWIEQRRLESHAELRAFGRFADLLVSGNRNAGEAAVLAYAKVHGATAIIDDRAGSNAARSSGVECRGTLGILCDAVRAGLLSVQIVSDLADHLLETEYRLPFLNGGFAGWAAENGLIDSSKPARITRVE